VHPETARRIVEAARLTPADTVLEVGPGDGALTRALLQEAGHVAAVEIDPARASALRERMEGPSRGRLRVLTGDALTRPYGAWLAEAGYSGPAVLVANLPYNVATPLLTRAMEEPETIARILATVQREVAERFAARAGERGYGYLSVRTAAFARARRLFDLPPGAFRPAPKVVSSVLEIVPLEGAPPPLRARALALASRAFQARRKVLPNALSGEGGRDRWVRALAALGKDARSRAEELAYADWLALAQAEEGQT
jgi:16S rRNA (adenine1518-N6/adenine1519-N6)-dimethyltransferase